MFVTCTGQNNKEKNVELIPEKFQSVEVNNSLKNDCSPAKFLPGHTGIEINAPDEVRYNADDKDFVIPICGYYKIKGENFTEHPGPLMIFLQLKDSEVIFSGPMLEPETGDEIPGPPSKRDRVNTSSKQMVTKPTQGSFFNPDLKKYVKFPMVPGTYSLHVEYGGEKSNVRQISFKLK